MPKELRNLGIVALCVLAPLTLKILFEPDHAQATRSLRNPAYMESLFKAKGFQFNQIDENKTYIAQKDDCVLYAMFSNRDGSGVESFLLTYPQSDHFAYYNERVTDTTPNVLYAFDTYRNMIVSAVGLETEMHPIIQFSASSSCRAMWQTAG